MLYKMNLAIEPFILIKEGKKTIEMRLKTKERENIKIGDQILFTNDSGEQMIADVISVSSFSSFIELYKHFDKVKLGYKDNEIANPDDMLKYYCTKDIGEFGVLAIEIKTHKMQK